MLRYLFARRPDWTVLVIACTLSLTLMLLEPHAQFRVAWFLQHTVLAPFENVAAWIEHSVGVYWENKQLRQRLTQVQTEADALRGERIENVRLRELLKLEQRRPYNLVAASVVGMSLDRLGGSLTLDRGMAEGIEPGRAILTPEGLVGRVDQATRHQARVLTLLHRDCAVAARLERSGVHGILEWAFGTRPILNLRYISSQEDVQVGDLVTTSGLGGIFPEGIRIGTVSKVSLDENGLMKEILVRPAVEFRSVEEVLAFIPSPLRGSSPADLFQVDSVPAARAPVDTLPAVAP